MSIIIGAMIGSIIVHLLFLIITMTIGIIRTKRYVPDIERVWEQVNELPSEVEFDRTVSPVAYIVSFTAVTFICGLILFLWNSVF
ncbi:hypothetical protein [Metabacillus sp. SLBN-84]